MSWSRTARTRNIPLATSDLYGQLPELDFSRHVLEGAEQSLRVLPVPACGWSDLGTPKRVAEALRASSNATSVPFESRSDGLPQPGRAARAPSWRCNQELCHEVLVTLALAVTGSALAADLATQPTLTLDGAKSVVAAAMSYARAKNAPGGAIAVVDPAAR